MTRVGDRVLRVALTGVHKLMKLGWFIRRPRTFGAHALALTPEGKLVLVKLRYARGWRLPGGGRGEHEPAETAALRELREEIGMLSHGEVTLACDVEEAIDYKRDCASIVIVRHVRYQPKRWRLEVEEVGEFSVDSLPRDMSPASGRWISALSSQLGG